MAGPVADAQRHPALEPFAVLVGEWEVRPRFGGAEAPAGARATFEWMEGGALLIQRWQVPVPEAPDGIAVFGWDEGRGTVVQHYFDSRGVIRLYAAALEGPQLTLERTEPDFSPLDFAQRFEAAISEDGSAIEGKWLIAHDGKTFEKDFDLSYKRI